MQSIAAIAGTGEAVSPEYLAKRIAEEARHAPNDDGTLTHCVRTFGTGHEYDEHSDPLLETDEPSRLIEFGLSERESNRMGEHCGTIHDVRAAVSEHTIPTWRQAGPVTEQHVIAALKKADEATE